MQTVLITGASTGIGLEFARLFARDRYTLILVVRNEQKLQVLSAELQESFDASVYTLSKDLSLTTSALELYEWCKEKGIRIDVLVNNAGFGDFGPYATSDWSVQEQMIQLNITTLAHLTRLFLPDMIANKQGNIINLASVAAFQPGPLMSVYFATKAFVLHFSEALDAELKGTGVKVTALCPGPTQSEFFASSASMQTTGLGKQQNLPTAAEVALYGYRAMIKGKRVAIHGIKYRILVALIGLIPRAVVTLVTKKMVDKKT